MSSGEEYRNGELERLAHSIRDCRLCGLCITRRYALPGEGNPFSRLFLIAQAPGEIEDHEGKMFTGPSGRILDFLLSGAGLSRKDVYITNLIKCYLPKCRRPAKREIDACTPYLEQEIALVNPQTIVPLGFHSTRYLLRKYDIPRPPKHEYQLLFGKILSLPGLRIMPLRHPTALLFNPEKEELMMANYKKLADLV